MGVPTLGCGCPVCTSSDPHDKRLRPSVVVRWPCLAESSVDARSPRANGHAAEPQKPLQPGLYEARRYENDQSRPCERVVLIDTGPDFREQALRSDIRRVDAVFYTHSHADHILGMDDLRPLSFATFKKSGPIPLYVTAETRGAMERIYSYTFSPDAKYTNRARVALQDVSSGARVHEVFFTPVPVFHGDLPITGYRFGNTAYLTDVSTIPESSFALLRDLDVLVVSALRHVPHPSHATVLQAVKWANRIDAKLTYFTHISHDLGHEETNANLPEGVELAYDGLTVPVTLS